MLRGSECQFMLKKGLMTKKTFALAKESVINFVFDCYNVKRLIEMWWLETDDFSPGNPQMSSWLAQAKSWNGVTVVWVCIHTEQIQSQYWEAGPRLRVCVCGGGWAGGLDFLDSRVFDLLFSPQTQHTACCVKPSISWAMDSIFFIGLGKLPPQGL